MHVKSPKHVVIYYSANGYHLVKLYGIKNNIVITRRRNLFHCDDIKI